MWPVNLRTYLAILVFFVAILCPVAVGRTIYVDADATGANDGSSWTNAYKYLQDALADANSTGGPVRIHVAKGIYTPDSNSADPNGSGDREATFQLINGVALKGGYAGFGAPDPNVRDVNEYETILNGDLIGNDEQVLDPCDLLNKLTRSENSYHVVTGNGVDETAVLDGFIVTGGNANGPLSPSPTGSTIYDDHRSPTPSNSALTIHPETLTCGGGLYNKSASPTLTNCRFRNNSASGRGGGMANFGSDSKLINCMFIGNSAGTRGGSAGSGGGIHNEGGAPILTNCTFTNNRAEYDGGGMFNKYESRPTLINCGFSGNSANAGGGMGNYRSTPTLTNCKFSGNSAERRGGGMSSNSSSPALVNCRLTNNWAYDRGGAMYDHESNPTLANCIFNGNSTGRAGGGMYSYDNTSLTLTNCTFVGNSGKDGNALHCYSFRHPSILRLANCILWDGGDEISNGDASTIIITYSNVQGGWPGEGNINADPCFADPGYWADANNPSITAEPNDPNAVWVDGDYHLKSQAGRWDPNNQIWVQDEVTSPCIDAGDPNSPIDLEPFPNGGIINMGAYGGTAEASKSYFGEPVCETIIAGDINGDCKVDFVDFTLIAIHWLEDNTP